MAQLQCPANYIPLQQVTAANLNAHVNNAILKGGAINEQTVISPGVESVDELIVYDNSATDIRKVTAGNFLAADLNIVSSSISAGSGKEMTITSYNGSVVSGSSYTSADGQTVVVTTPAAHGLLPGNIVEITLASAGYNGTFKLSAASGTSFTYVVSPIATAGSGFLSYQRKATSNVTGNLSVSDRLYVNGITSDSSIVATTASFAGPATFNGSATFNNNVNFTGTVQFNGTVGYMLTEIYEETIPHYGSIAAGLTNALHTTSAFTKPVGEIWEMEISLRYYGAAGYTYEFAGRYGSQTPQTGSYLFYERRHDGAGGGAVGNELYTCRWILTSAETFTSETIKIDTLAGSGSGLQLGMQTGLAGSVCSGPVYPSKFRIYKYKTA
jgi:hypothetical protein